MKKVSFKIQFVAVMLVLAAAFLGFQAQVRSSANKAAAADAVGNPASFSMAVVDVQFLLTQSDAAKSIEGQIKTQRDQFQKEISERERKLKDEEQVLIASNGKVGEEEFNKKKAGLEKNVIEARQLVQKRRKSLEEAASAAAAQLRMEITKIVAEKAESRKYDIVISKQNVVLAEKSMDITAEVMKDLNGKITKIDLKVQTN